MKKLLLLAAATIAYQAGFAQQIERVPTGIDYHNPVVGSLNSSSSATAKTTKLSDSLIIFNSKVSQYDSTTATLLDAVAPIDSGYAFGTNFKNDKGWAEQYDFNYKTDTSINVLGIFAAFSGKISPTSTKTITFKLWDRGAQVAAGTKKYLTGYPNNILKSLNVPIVKVGLGNLSKPDTFKYYYFSTQQTMVKTPFYVGCDLASLSWTATGGDTFSVRTSYPGRGAKILNYTVNSTFDTLITTRNAINTATGTWEDAYWIRGYARNLAMIPIIRFQSSLSVSGITHNNLTFYGNYPNPASSATNIKYSVLQPTDVSITITDMTGRSVQNYDLKNVLAGTHTLNVPLVNLSSGNYLYIIRTTDGDGIASQFSVVK